MRAKEKVFHVVNVSGVGEAQTMEHGSFVDVVTVAGENDAAVNVGSCHDAKVMMVV